MERIESELTSEAEVYLQQLVQKIKYEGVKTGWKVLSGKAAETLAEHATETGANLIVVATHGRSGVSRWVWGSVADRDFTLCVRSRPDGTSPRLRPRV